MNYLWLILEHFYYLVGNTIVSGIPETFLKGQDFETRVY